MKRILIITGVVIALLLLTTCSRRAQQKTSLTLSDKQIRAVSLTQLQSALRKCMPSNSCAAELTQFGGITRVLGVFGDKPTSDLVVFGESDPHLPPLRTEDFVVALRSAWLRYAVLNGNVYEYENPGCSIDPNPAVIRQLSFAGTRNVANAADKEKSIAEWNRVCESPQGVRVLGIPFDTHFAQVMVKADYDMKRLVDGSDLLDIPGLVSVTDLDVSSAQAQIDQRQPVSLSGAHFNRFWFYPGENVYAEDGDVILIRECPVKLLTEQNYNARGDKQAGNVDRLADDFARSLTILFDKVAQTRPVYAELAGLFRFEALAKIMKSRLAQNGPDLSYFLDSYPVALTTVDRSLPGRHAVKQIQHSDTTPTGRIELTLWFPSCGGVDIGIEPKIARFERPAPSELSDLSRDLLGSRLATDAPYWVFKKSPTAAIAKLEHNARIQEANTANTQSRLFTVSVSSQGRSLDYQLFDGQTAEHFSNVADLVRVANEKMTGDPREVIYFDLEGFTTDDKIEGFASACRIKQATLNKNLDIVTLPRQNGSLEMQEALFSRGIRFDKATSRVEEVVASGSKGRFRAVLQFFTNVGGAVRKVVVRVICKTRSQAEAILSTVNLRSSTRQFQLSSVSDVVNQIRLLLKEEDLPELGDINISKLVMRPQAVMT
jgi:hypothetical protein